MSSNKPTSSGYTVTFHEDKAMHSSSQTLECKNLSKKLFQRPSDRHMYGLKFYTNPVRWIKLLYRKIMWLW
jgi:hypothetical protein